METQAARLLEPTASGLQRQVDAVFLILALYNLLLAVELAKGVMEDRSLKQPIKRYHDAFGGELKLARDSVVHFDTWRAGSGNKQPKAADGSWIVNVAVGVQPPQAQVVVTLGPGRSVPIDVQQAVDAATRLAEAAQTAINSSVS